MGLEPLDEPVGRAVVVQFGIGLGKFRKNLLGELLAEFNTPLVIAVDVPDNALGEDLVFVHGNEGTECFRRNVVHHDGVGRLVAFEHLVRGEECDFFFALAVLAEFFLSLGERLAVHQGFGLCKEVGEQLLVMVADLVVAVCRGDEVARNHLGALVDELVEGVLAVGARFAPEDRTGLVVDAQGVAVNSLAVGFHVGLLEVSGEAVQVLVVREHRVAGSAEEVVVPNADEGEDNRHVLVGRSGLEVLIHLVGTLVELHVVLEADAERDGKADGRPQGVAAADPVPEFEHVGGVDTEGGNGFGVGGERHEVLGDGLLVAIESLEHCSLGRFGVGHGLKRRERLGSDDEERLFDVHLLEGFGHVGAVDVRNKVDFRGGLAGNRLFCIRLESFGHHHRTEVGTADTDVHNVLDGLAGVALPLAGTHELGEFFHVLEHGANFGHHVLAVDADRIVALVAECSVEHGALFGGVNLFASEILGTHFFEVCRLQEVLELGHRFVGDDVLGVVKEESAGFQAELAGACRVLCEEFLHVPGLGDFGMGLKGLPFRRISQFRHRLILSAARVFVARVNLEKFLYTFSVMDTSILDKAIVFAVKAHQGAERKGKGFPYIVHPMEAVSIAATMTSDQELLAAAVLHDTVEDTNVTLKDVEREFGKRIAELVEAESDIEFEGKSRQESWRLRKEEAIERLSTATNGVKIVALADKLSNIRAIYRDYQAIGDKVWDLFCVKDKALHEWHFRGLARALASLKGTFAYDEFAETIDKVFKK